MLEKVLLSVMDQWMIMTNSFDSEPTFHCIGHSLGAHVCSFLGKGPCRYILTKYILIILYAIHEPGTLEQIVALVPLS